MGVDVAACESEGVGAAEVGDIAGGGDGDRGGLSGGGEGGGGRREYNRAGSAWGCIYGGRAARGVSWIKRAASARWSAGPVDAGVRGVIRDGGGERGCPVGCQGGWRRCGERERDGRGGIDCDDSAGDDFAGSRGGSVNGDAACGRGRGICRRCAAGGVRGTECAARSGWCAGPIHASVGAVIRDGDREGRGRAGRQRLRSAAKAPGNGGRRRRRRGRRSAPASYEYSRD